MSFFKHPRKVCMTYTEHMKLSLGFSYLFFKGAITAFVHAFYPDAFVTSTSDINEIVKKKIENSGCRK